MSILPKAPKGYVCFAFNGDGVDNNLHRFFDAINVLGFLHFDGVDVNPEAAEEQAMMFCANAFIKTLSVRMENLLGEDLKGEDKWLFKFHSLGRMGVENDKGEEQVLNHIIAFMPEDAAIAVRRMTSNYKEDYEERLRKKQVFQMLLGKHNNKDIDNAVDAYFLGSCVSHLAEKNGFDLSLVFRDAIIDAIVSCGVARKMEDAMGTKVATEPKKLGKVTLQ